MAVYSQGSTYNEATHRMKIALWISRRSRPFSIVEDEELLDIFHDLNARCVTPKRRTVSRDVQEIFALSRLKVGEMLRVCVLYVFLGQSSLSLVFQAYPGKIHIGTDGWTSPQVISFIGLTVHWIINGKIVSAILDFIKCEFLYILILHG
jgi:hypothetical protein